MKKMFLGLGIGMAGGMTLATYVLTNPKTKKSVDRMLNNAMDYASDKMQDMKKM